ncbi:MAG: CAP family protein [Methanotrichaceae archaeon]|nr:CAP family protein [Methanotrichaceae archaeon]
MYARIISMILASSWLIMMLSCSQSSVDGLGNFKEDILAAHNKYRADLNIAPLMWSDELATHAQSWADHLASLGGTTLEHSPEDTEGENLWLGSASIFNYTAMVDSWGNEKQYFIKGIFPDVSSTKNWKDVGHYTQIIWQNSSQVGCAIASAGGNDILVCRYNPPGNWHHESVFNNMK